MVPKIATKIPCDKCKVININWNPTYKTELHLYSNEDNSEIIPLENSKTEKDIGVLIDERLNYSQHIKEKVNKAN